MNNQNDTPVAILQQFVMTSSLLDEETKADYCRCLDQLATNQSTDEATLSELNEWLETECTCLEDEAIIQDDMETLEALNTIRATRNLYMNKILDTIETQFHHVREKDVVLTGQGAPA